MAKLVMASDGDTLCTLAIAHGFIDCTQLRKEPNNQIYLKRPLRAGDWVTIPDLKPTTFQKAVDSLHVLVKKSSPPVAVRFVRGTADEKHYMHDSALSELQLSKFRTDKGAADSKAAFSSAFGFQQAADADPDTFRVEVVDPAAGGSVNVKLEALKPVYASNGSITQYVEFTSEVDAAHRKIESLACQALGGAPVVFRSKYMRLVVDKWDKDAAPGQTLLVTDLVDGGNEKLEILDQKVRITYVIGRCPGTGGQKCAVAATIPVGKDRMRAKVALHVLKDGAGQPYAPLADAKKRLLKFVRQYFAQANMSVKLVVARTIPEPSNMFAVANETGDLAAGGTIQVRLAIDGVVKTVTCATTAGDAPIQTATALADAINLAYLADGVDAQARASENPPCTGAVRGSADVLVGDVFKQKVEIDAVLQEDPAQPVDPGLLDGTPLVDFGGNDSHVGTLDERVVLKNFDTGADRIDVFVVNQLAGAYGEAFTPERHSAASQQPNDTVRNSVMVGKTSVLTDAEPTTIPHELGHVLMDAYHANEITELMDPLTRPNADSREVDGSKRICDPIPPREIDMGCKKGSPYKFLRGENAEVVDSW